MTRPENRLTALRIGPSVLIENFFAGNFSNLLETLETLLEDSTPKLHVGLNAHALFWANHDQDFRRAVSEADLVTADGASIMLAGKMLGFRVDSRLAGIDILEALLKLANEKGWGVSFVGPRPYILDALRENCRKKYPNLAVSVYPWRPDADFAAELGRQAKLKGERLLFAGLPRPLQDVWLHQNKNLIAMPLMMGVGGSFEVLSGEVSRAPHWVRRLNCEWLYRFTQEPARRFLPTLRSTVWLAAYLLRCRAGTRKNKP